MINKLSCIAACVAILGLLPYSALAQLDSANAMADSLLKSCGGRELWAQTRMIHIEELTWFQQLNEPVIQSIWVDLEEPRVRFELKSKSMNRVRAFTKDQGWGLLETGKFYSFTAERIQSDVLEWNTSLYRVLHLLASSDQLVLEREGENRLLVSSSDGIQAWFDLSPHGRLLRFGKDEQYQIYGPMKEFGQFRLPKWGVQQDGSWNFEYMKVRVVDPLSVNFSPP